MLIKPLASTEEICQVAEVEARTWGMEAGNTVPGHLLTAIAREGGLLLGAYLDGRLVGFTLGWLGTVEPTASRPAVSQLKLVSHMTGVLEGYRDHRIGFQLKLAQRDWALARGLDLITWTYDPLESRNGYFNIHLLGCRCQTYLENYYGEMSDRMNSGIPSDRFRVDWWIRAPEVEAVLAGANGEPLSQPDLQDLELEGCQLLNPARRDAGGEPCPGDVVEAVVGRSRMLVEIPTDYQAVRAQNPSLALNWRLHTREIFQGLFKAGCQAADFIYLREPEPRSFYLLEVSDAN